MSRWASPPLELCSAPAPAYTPEQQQARSGDAFRLCGPGNSGRRCRLLRVVVQMRLATPSSQHSAAREDNAHLPRDEVQRPSDLARTLQVLWTDADQTMPAEH